MCIYTVSEGHRHRKIVRKDKICPPVPSDQPKIFSKGDLYWFLGKYIIQHRSFAFEAK